MHGAFIAIILAVDTSRDLHGVHGHAICMVITKLLLMDTINQSKYNVTCTMSYTYTLNNYAHNTSVLVSVLEHAMHEQPYIIIVTLLTSVTASLVKMYRTGRTFRGGFNFAFFVGG